MCLDPSRPAVAALLPGFNCPALADLLLPADRARSAHTEPLRRLPAGQPASDRSNNPATKINGKGFGHAC